MKRIGRGVVRYGLRQDLYRVLTVELNENTSCTGQALHLVNAVRATDGEHAQWWIGDTDLPRYVDVRSED